MYVTQATSIVLGTAIAWGGVEVVSNILTPPERTLVIDRLEYVVIDGKGHIRQQVVSRSGQIIPAKWKASLERQKGQANQLLCNGSGVGNYNGEVSTWDLDTWTGSDCPDLASSGDVFEVSWTYDDAEGFVVSIGGRFVLSETGELIPE